MWFISPNEPLLRFISIVLLAFFSIIQLAKIIQRKKLFTSKPVLLYVLFTSWALLSIVWAQDKTMAIDRFLDLICNALFLIISYDFFLGAKINKKVFISIFVVVGILFTTYVFLYYGLDRYFSMLLAGRRVGGDIINVNFIGMISTMTIVMILYSSLNNIYRSKIILLLLIPLLIIALGSGSKKVLIGLAVGVLVIFVLYMKGRMTWKKIVTIALSFVLLLISIFAIRKLPYFNTVFERMDVMFSTLSEGSSSEGSSTEARKEFIEEGFNTFLDYPILGIGLNNSGIITRDIVGREVYLHCNYVELLACLGIVGFALYYAIYALIIIKTIQLNNNKSEKNYLPIVIAIVLLTVEIGCVTYYEIKTSMYFILMSVLISKRNWIIPRSLGSDNNELLLNSTSKDDNANNINKGKK